MNTPRRLTKKERLVAFWTRIGQEIESTRRLDGGAGLCLLVHHNENLGVSGSEDAMAKLREHCYAFWAQPRNRAKLYMAPRGHWRPRALLAYFLALEAADGQG